MLDRLHIVQRLEWFKRFGNRLNFRLDLNFWFGIKPDQVIGVVILFNRFNDFDYFIGSGLFLGRFKQTRSLFLGQLTFLDQITQNRLGFDFLIGILNLFTDLAQSLLVDGPKGFQFF